MISGTSLDHQSFFNLDYVGDRIFRCQIDENGLEEAKVKNNWSRFWVRTGILGILQPDGDLCSFGHLSNRMSISSRFQG